MYEGLACIAYETNKGVEFIAQEEWDHKLDFEKVYYDIINQSQSISMKDMRKALNYAMTTWDVEIDIDFHPKWYPEYRDKEAHVTIEFKTSENDDLFRDRPSVLAYAYLPKTSKQGVIVFNDDRIWGLKETWISVKEAREKGYPVRGDPSENTALKVHNVIHVLIHELGHFLGLLHDVTGNRNGEDVMDAFYDGKRLDLSERDIYRIRLKYPIENFEHWARYARFKRWLKLRVRRF
jgi:predicted Zn-dependent protease